MRGRPLLRFFLTACALAGAAALIFGLTRSPVTGRDIPGLLVDVEQTAGLQFLVESPEPIERLRILLHGEPLFDVAPRSKRVEQGVALLYPKQGADLVVESDWEDGERDGPHALRVRIRRGLETLVDETLWSDDAEVTATIPLPAETTP